MSKAGDQLYSVACVFVRDTSTADEPSAENNDGAIKISQNQISCWIPNTFVQGIVADDEKVNRIVGGTPVSILIPKWIKEDRGLQ